MDKKEELTKLTPSIKIGENLLSLLTSYGKDVVTSFKGVYSTIHKWNTVGSNDYVIFDVYAAPSNAR